MPLIQRLTLAFYSVFLLLTGLALGQDACKQAVEELFGFARAQARKMKTNPFMGLDQMLCYVTPDEPLIDLLHSVHEDPISLADGRKKKNEAIILNNVKIGHPEGDYRTVIFTVKHPKDNKTGTVKIVCKGPDCHALVDNLQQHIGPYGLSCVVKIRDQYFMSTSPQDGIEVAIPHTIMQPVTSDILTELFKPQKTKRETWTASNVLVLPNTILLSGRSHVAGEITRVQMPLPALPKVAFDYLNQACRLFNKQNQGVLDISQYVVLTFNELPLDAEVSRSKGPPTGKIVADAKLIVSGTSTIKKM